MELRQLRNFLTICEEGSITAAARALRITQPALSRQIKAMEDDIGTPLLERGAHSVSLTPAGETLVAEGKKLVRAADALVEKVKLTGLGEPLRIGYAPSLAAEFLGVAIERFTQIHPRVRVSLHDRSTAEMCAGLASGKLDLIVAPPGPQQDVKWDIIRTYGWRLVMKSSHPLAGKKKITPADLDGVKLLLYEREHYPEYWDRITSFFRDNKLQAKVAGEFDGITSLFAALEAGLGVAFLAENVSLGNGQRNSLKAIPLRKDPGEIVVSAGIPADGGTRPAVLAFIAELKRAASGK